VGDAILIFYGDPETKGVREDALACVEMAVAMRERIRDLEKLWRQSGIENPLLCRMGIHTGYCTVGNFGSEDRMDYTIIGGAVNTASRLETLAEPGQILISYETFAHVKDKFHCEKHGKAKVKGIAYPVDTYLVNDSYENLSQLRNRFLEEHNGMKVDLNFDAMNSDDQDHAADVLRRALNWLEDNKD
jgi:class 3 adenylate cyclase